MIRVRDIDTIAIDCSIVVLYPKENYIFPYRIIVYTALTRVQCIGSFIIREKIVFALGVF